MVDGSLIAKIMMMEGNMMTEKRFMVDDCGTLIDMQTGDTFDYVSDVCGLLNKYEELREENKELRLLVDTFKEQNMKFKLRLKDLGVEYL